MPKRRSSRCNAARVARTRNLARRSSRAASARPKPDEASDQARAPNTMEWPDPLNDAELRALEAGWGFIE